VRCLRAVNSVESSRVTTAAKVAAERECARDLCRPINREDRSEVGTRRQGTATDGIEGMRVHVALGSSGPIDRNTHGISKCHLGTMGLTMLDVAAKPTMFLPLGGRAKC